jgi:hypothetical protein
MAREPGLQGVEDGFAPEMVETELLQRSRSQHPSAHSNFDPDAVTAEIADDNIVGRGRSKAPPGNASGMPSLSPAERSYEFAFDFDFSFGEGLVNPNRDPSSRSSPRFSGLTPPVFLQCGISHRDISPRSWSLSRFIDFEEPSLSTRGFQSMLNLPWFQLQALIEQFCESQSC